MPTTRKLAFVITLLLASIAAPAHAAFSGTDVFLPSVGRAAGISNWYTTVWVHNPGTVQATAQFTFLVRDQVNTSATPVTKTIAAGATVKYANAMSEIFGREGFGAIRVMSNQKLVVNSRIYARATSETDTSSKGQFFAGVPASFAIGTGEKSQLLGVFQTQPSASSAFRYNFGFVETTGQDCTVRVTPRSPTGAVLATGKSYPVRRLEQRQFQFKDEFAAVSTSNARLEVEVTAGNGRVIAFGSGIANGSSDPSTFEMSYRDDLLAENASGSGTITGVSAGNGLTGGGTTGTVTLNVGAGEGLSVSPDGVALANGGVTKAKLSAGGGSSGQVLATDGANLVWQTPSGGGGGLTLPYEGSASTSGDAFNVRNTGNGVAVTGTTASTLGSLGLALYGVAGQTLVSGGAGVRGYFGPGNDGNSGALGTETFGVYGESTNCGGEAGGVRGYSACTGNTGTIGSPSAGVLGTTDNMQGVLGRQGAGSGSAAPSYAGVWGDSTSGPGVYGSSAGGYGVYGSGYTAGIRGEGSMVGVHGQSTNVGVHGQGTVGVTGQSTSGEGVHGFSTSGKGVHGDSTYSYGVHGESTNGDGVFGQAFEGAKSGVFAVNDNPAGYAAFMRGNASVTGTLSKGGGAFRIDHPLDPENRILQHSFVESPDMMNIYNGNVVTDALGEAVVELPPYFEALNRDFRYQLTVIGVFAQAIVAQKVMDGRFVIRSDQPGVEVSWQVTGIRRDAWAEANRIVVEQDKPEAERGLYLHPAALGQPPDKDVETVRHPDVVTQRLVLPMP